MAYTKTEWVDQEGQVKYTETADGDYKIFTPNFDDVTEMGTPVDAIHMNNIENGIEYCDKNMVVRKSTTQATGSSTQPVYVKADGTVETCGFEMLNTNFDGQWVYKKLLITTSTTAIQTPYEFDLHTYLGVPSDNTTQYEILFAHSYHAGTSNTRKGIIYSDVISDYFTGSGNDGYGSMATTDQGRTTGYIGIIPVKTKLYMDLKGNFTTNELIAIGYRRLGTNQ